MPVVRQFLAGDTEGPIGMSEEKDATKTDQATRPRGTSEMTADETDEMERAAGAPTGEETGAAASHPRPIDQIARRKKSI